MRKNILISIFLSVFMSAFFSLKAYSLVSPNNIEKFMESCESGDIATIKSLIHKPDDLNCVNQDALSPLHVAVHSPNTKALEFLLSFSDINVNIPDDLGCTPILESIFADNTEAFKILINDKRVDLNSEKIPPLLNISMLLRRNKISEILLKHPKIDCTYYSYDFSSPLHISIETEQVDILKKLLKIKNIDVNLKDEFGYTPLHIAVKTDNKEIIKLLLAHKDINVNSYTSRVETPFSLAVSMKRKKAAKLLLADKRTNPNLKPLSKHFQFPLINAVENNDIDICKLLINDPRTNIFVKNRHGKTPLYISTNSYNRELTHILLMRYLGLKNVSENSSIYRSCTYPILELHF